MKTKLLCIYLPQFHVIPENDEWWGKGFTEWFNVKRGKPFYPGHYQPREPLHDNYYDLSNLKVLEKHTRMAKKAGISGFCFYHYYFKGRKLLEKPIENYRDKSKEKFPYCLIWANQSWARTWYRSKIGNKTLLQQVYGEEKDWEEHFYYLLDFFKDERYIKVDNKPIYIIYLPQDIRCRSRMFDTWQRLARENGFNGIYLIAMDTHLGKDHCSQFYDAYMEFEPLNLIKNDKSWRRYVQQWKCKHIDDIDIKKCRIRNKIWTQNVYSYSYLCRCLEKKAKNCDPKAFLGVFAGWDNTSRKDGEGSVVTGSNPKMFGENIGKMLRLSEKNSKEFLFLNAWNEWSEGAYIEPDKKYGYGYLKALKEAVAKYSQE